MIDPRFRTPQKEHQPWKQAVVNDFLRGASVADIATQSACHKLRVEQVLREAIAGLATLSQTSTEPIAQEQAV